MSAAEIASGLSAEERADFDALRKLPLWDRFVNDPHWDYRFGFRCAQNAEPVGTHMADTYGALFAYGLITQPVWSYDKKFAREVGDYRPVKMVSTLTPLGRSVASILRAQKPGDI